MATSAVAASLAGCGAPDLAAMRPTVQKSAVLVEVVGAPPFAPSASQLGTAGATSVEVVHVALGEWQSVAAHALAKGQLTGVMVVCDDANAVASGLNQLAADHPDVRFLVVSNWPASQITSGNVEDVAQDPVAVAYSIGALCGDWIASSTSTSGAVYSGVPSIVYAPRGATVAEQKAFFTGLYQANPNVRVVALPQPAAQSLSSYGYAVDLGVVGGSPAAGELSALRSAAPAWAAFGTSPIAGFAISPGHLSSSEAVQAFQALVSPDAWHSGEHLVLDLSSVAFDDKQVPATVIAAWAKLEVNAIAAAAQSNAAFASLPPSVRSDLANAFHLS
ncbi:hypothetical protein SAMN05421799_106116 [Alicyclobacillus vulcanalis]|uniref:Uncharacterized protein n=1 Tax=Alicyclobacillus vulcanalis TaxID=252246 RepID=A0A1N7MTW2_9BACL|nr:hypothetical protein SAMN05421799_106116 [Alicyclobacillus vulcanalis]